MASGISPEMVGAIGRLRENIGSVFPGRDEAVRLCLTAFLAGEHVLLEDVPGVGKTLLARALARSVDGSFHRLQFTPDLLPADITGSSIFDAKRQEFVFMPGPVFANVLLADEINRTTPRTQSALLEAMSDAQVSSDGQTHQLPLPFFVIATQNPYEFEGTYLLPESQLDRFQVRVSLGYPDRESTRRIMESQRLGDAVVRLRPALSMEQVLEIQQAVREVRIDPAIRDYILDLTDATRSDPRLRLGVSVRGVLALAGAAQSRAMIDGRDYVVPDDVKQLAVPVLAHRLLLFGGPFRASSDADDIVRDLLETIPAPK